jgi:ATP synthase protein I
MSNTKNKQEPPENSKKESSKVSLRKALQFSSLGLMLPSSIAVGLFFGHYLDKWLGTHPWMIIIFLLFGIASGFISLFRGLNRYKDI